MDLLKGMKDPLSGTVQDLDSMYPPSEPTLSKKCSLEKDAITLR